MWKWLLKQVMKSVVSNDTFGKIQTLVVTVSTDESLTGSQKREKVLTEAKSIGAGLQTHMLNLAIESAVVMMKEQSK